eukprot:2163351-Heterocapsa_arctica.AAC.1
MEEATYAIMEELHLDHHHIVSPIMEEDRNFIISVVLAYDPDRPQDRPGFKFFKRCDMRDTASFLRKMEYMEGNEDNTCTIEGFTGTFREHPGEVAGTILESMLGLGAIYEQYGFTELEDLPETIVVIEEGLKRHRTNFRSHRMRKKEWNWHEYDKIW